LPSIDTKKFQLTELEKKLGTKLIFGTALLGKSDSIVVHIPAANDSIALNTQQEIVIGRSDPQANHYPDVDLLPYGAVEDGVSRIHARLQRMEDNLNLIDMGSANGTYLNGQRLIPKQPRVVRDGDEVRFGKLVVRIYFKHS
jgi:pSer/pThr/pTyr-binding forkhead associated (FHA) protein